MNAAGHITSLGPMNGKLTPARAVMICASVSGSTMHVIRTGYRVDSHGSQPLDQYDEEYYAVAAGYREYSQSGENCLYV